jgi:hypothetical protein
MILLNTIRNLLKEKSPESTTLVMRGQDRRKENMGRKTERRKYDDRRRVDSNSANYEFIGLSYGGWAKTD